MTCTVMPAGPEHQPLGLAGLDRARLETVATPASGRFTPIWEVPAAVPLLQVIAAPVLLSFAVTLPELTPLMGLLGATAPVAEMSTPVTAEAGMLVRPRAATATAPPIMVLRVSLRMPVLVPFSGVICEFS
ncbi:hypothetical protein EBO15_06755 [Actinomadura harenae]|uniref:Uncharacterized protein n=1 Tax=Actinomadura harenae TaxID=2483351 RepID=A0A3M2MH79_9ACTN|nr:hypothetical protein EBO15_06755 [Actinomadura harenae]